RPQQSIVGRQDPQHRHLEYQIELHPTGEDWAAVMVTASLGTIRESAHRTLVTR
ncbi:hypothetical protein KI387_020855, partial [Taxus chinensis]